MLPFEEISKNFVMEPKKSHSIFPLMVCFSTFSFWKKPKIWASDDKRKSTAASRVFKVPKVLNSMPKEIIHSIFFLQNNIKKLTKNSYIHTDLSDWSTNMVHQIDPHQPIHHINLSNWSAQLIHLIDQSNWFIYLIFYNYPLIDSPNWPTRLICSIRFFSFLLCSVLLCFEMEWFWGNI